MHRHLSLCYACRRRRSCLYLSIGLNLVSPRLQLPCQRLCLHPQCCWAGPHLTACRHHNIWGLHAAPWKAFPCPTQYCQVSLPATIVALLICACTLPPCNAVLPFALGLYCDVLLKGRAVSSLPSSKVMLMITLIIAFGPVVPSCSPAKCTAASHNATRKPCLR